MRLLEYYREPAVRSRLVEFLGGSSLAEASTPFITAGDGRILPRTPGDPVTSLWNALNRGHEVARSSWDRQSLLAHLDIEYVNFDHPLEAYQCPSHAFRAQAPVVRSVEEILVGHGIAPLHLLSGRGHHFVWRIAKGSECFRGLEAMGSLSPSLAESYGAEVAPTGESVGRSMGAAYSGLGLLMEYLGHRVLEDCRSRCSMSVQLTAVEAGPPAGRGREVVSIDLSEYGDPLHCRTIRMPFGAYLKTRKWLPDATLQPLVMIPHHEVDEEQALSIMRDLSQAADLARRASVQIPEQSAGSARLLASYLSSEMATFHNWYHSEKQECPAFLLNRDYHSLPPCLGRILEDPNDWLLRPAGIQLVVRGLWAQGWHPRQIAGLILSKYQENRGWREGVHFHDPGCRADFYTRLFAGLLLLGQDDMVDLNCRSTDEKGYCCHNCERDYLLPLREAARRRTRQERNERI